MKILFDHQIFSLQNYGGISRYFSALSQGLKSNEGISSHIKLLYSRNHYLEAKNSVLSKTMGELFLKKQKKIYKWNEKYSKYLIGKNDFDVFHPTYYNPYFLDSLKRPYVITVHDMIHELFPEFFAPNDETVLVKKKAINKANHIIAISESTKRDLQLLLNIPEDKITVIHHSLFDKLVIHSEPQEQGKSKHSVPYVLYVGSRDGYKNFYKFITATANILKGYDIALLCVGGGSFGIAEVELINRLNLAQYVKQVDAHEEELKLYYANAVCFVYPSLYEGFGLPILEAFNNKCPVVCSNTSCFPETAGDSAVYFNPKDIDDIAAAVNLVLTDEKLRSNLIENGLKRLQMFSLTNCLQKTMDCYNKLIQ
ncbi:MULTISPECIES: glycosyltransferase family 4 protein [Olivibacter]|jgi:glycosyltransferase involved in cell wall biosynthesis|uniref:Glycosyltransferase family 4 protein n=1 Tax=Olivibacter oleidegradans TaxID=760123 RepID=A0ABV6HRR5_9SPHI|nr:glycosyltransferase family 1 protein [Olivibacter jilunii]